TPAEVAAALAPFAVEADPTRRRRSRWPAVAALLLAGVVAAAAGAYRTQTDNGERVISVEGPDVQVGLSRGGKEGGSIDPRTNKRVSVPTGAYDVAVKDKPEGIEVKADRIVVSRGKETLVTIERADKATRQPAEARPRGQADEELILGI